VKKNDKLEELDNFQIDHLLRNEKGFRGVYARDTLPKQINPHEISVVNYDKASGQGTHWVLVYNNPKNEAVYFFDSFGMAPGEEIQKYLRTAHKPIEFSTSEIQELGSVLCGYYCVYVAEELNKGRDFYDVLYEFNPYPTEENEDKMESIGHKWNI